MVDTRFSLQIFCQASTKIKLGVHGKKWRAKGTAFGNRGEGWREELIPAKPKVIVALLKGRCFKMMCANFMDERCCL